MKANSPRETSPWNDALDQLREWDPDWAAACLRMTSDPWTAGLLPPKTVELISVALNSIATALNPDGVRRHIRAALAVGATREEILMVVKMASMMAIHSCTLGGSILLEELPPSDLRERRDRQATPTSDQLRAAGRWNPAWDTFSYLDPVWTDELIAVGLGIDASRAVPQKLVELLSIALHASPAHLHPAGLRRHIKAALRAGVKAEEIIEVLKLCVVQGVQACSVVVLILADELSNRVAGSQPTP